MSDSDRLDAAIRELVAAIRAEMAEELPDGPVTLLDVDEAARRLSIGRTRLYREMAGGRLRSVKVGRRRLVPADALSEYVAAP